MNYRLFLLQILKEKQLNNSLFSLRALAKQLAISPSHLSQLLSGKRPLSSKIALKITKKLNLNEAEKANILAQVQEDGKNIKGNKIEEEYKNITSQEFEPISEWYYFAILSLSKLKTNKSSAKWISNKLNISFFEAKEAYEKLKLLRYLKEENGKFIQTTPPMHSTRDIPSHAIRKYHKQYLDLAKIKIEEISVEQREYASITTAIDIKKLPKAKKMIHEFKVKLSKFLSTNSADAVYTFAAQLFPVTTISNNTTKKD